MINLSFEKAVVPAKLKEAIVRPIYKGGNKKQITNYRPIAILPAIDKIIEQIVFDRIWKFVQKNKIICKNQYGFQKGKSTNQLLGDFANEMNTALGKRHHVLVLYLDFSKAFDTLDHNKLISALQKGQTVGLADQLPTRWKLQC